MDDSGLSAGIIPVRDGQGGEAFSWERTKERFVLGSNNRDQPGADVRSPLPVLAGRLFFATSRCEPERREGWHFFSTEPFIKYTPVREDFGPFNLGMTHQFVEQLRETLTNPAHKGLKIVYYCSPDAASMTNAAYLLGAFLCVDLNMTPDQAWLPFSALHPAPFRPYRDSGQSFFFCGLTVRDCWAGILKARAAGLYDPGTFDKDEYFYYDQPAFGDMHEVVRGKLFAFKGPAGRRRALGRGRYSLIPSDYFDVWRAKGVTAVVRLNSKEYDREVVTAAGFKHTDLPLEGGSAPPDEAVERFLRAAESEEGAVAVHCESGLGCTGTLIALYVMKHHRFTVREAMGWLRVCRPGSVVGPQQQYLLDAEGRMRGAPGAPRGGGSEVRGEGGRGGSGQQGKDADASPVASSQGVEPAMVDRETQTPWAYP